MARSFSSHIAQLTWMFSRYTPSLCDRDAATRMQGEGGWTQTRWTAVVMMGPANIVSGSAARTRAISGSAFSSPAKNTHGSDQLHGWNQTNYNELESTYICCPPSPALPALSCRLFLVLSPPGPCLRQVARCPVLRKRSRKLQLFVNR